MLHSLTSSRLSVKRAELLSPAEEKTDTSRQADAHLSASSPSVLQVHKFTLLSLPLCYSLQRAGRGGRRKEQVGTFFKDPVIFYLISQELLDYKSKVCQRKREDNRTQTAASHSSLHQEKSHPRAKPPTFLGPLTLFRVSLCLCRPRCGI